MPSHAHIPARFKKLATLTSYTIQFYPSIVLVTHTFKCNRAASMWLRYADQWLHPN